MTGSRRPSAMGRNSAIRRIPVRIKPLSGLPPMIAVIDIFFLTLFFFLPGQIAALVLVIKEYSAE